MLITLRDGLSRSTATNVDSAMSLTRLPTSSAFVALLSFLHVRSQGFLFAFFERKSDRSDETQLLCRCFSFTLSFYAFLRHFPNGLCRVFFKEASKDSKLLPFRGYQPGTYPF